MSLAFLALNFPIIKEDLLSGNYKLDENEQDVFHYLSNKGIFENANLI